ncbi:MAG: hypothetical protein ABL901_00875 [Hyphomicrobiaceae bacterium]
MIFGKNQSRKTLKLLTLTTVTLIAVACGSLPPVEQGGSGKPIELSEGGGRTVKACLSPVGQKAWLDRSKSQRADEETLQLRAAEVAAREVGLPITARSNFLTSTARGFGQIFGAADPICGNWCGAGRRYGQNMSILVVDELDAACKRHEECTVNHGLGVSKKGASCSCDQKLADEILKGRNLVSLSETEKSVVMYLQGLPCGGGCKRIENVQLCGS